MKCLWRPMALAAVAIVCFAALAEAQQGGQPGRRPGQGGPWMMRGGGSLLWLARNEAVQKEIELLDDQKAQLDKLAEELRPQRGGDGGERPDYRNMSEEERQKFRDEMRKRFEERTKTANEKLKKVLLPHQVKRLEQISLQLRGTGALADPDVASKLGLSEDQQTKVEETMAANREAVMAKARELRQGGRNDQAREQLRKLRKEGEAKVLAVLTAEQKEKFEQLKGQKFEMPEGAFGRRGGPRDREGQGRPRGQGRRPQPSTS
jgi:Spy/CpxP family protein refolding chaperone